MLDSKVIDEYTKDFWKYASTARGIHEIEDVYLDWAKTANIDINEFAAVWAMVNYDVNDAFGIKQSFVDEGNIGDDNTDTYLSHVYQFLQPIMRKKRKQQRAQLPEEDVFMEEELPEEMGEESDVGPESEKKEGLSTGPKPPTIPVEATGIENLEKQPQLGAAASDVSTEQSTTPEKILAKDALLEMTKDIK